MKPETREKKREENINQEMLFYKTSAEVILKSMEAPVKINLTDNPAYQERRRKLYEKLGWG